MGFHILKVQYTKLSFKMTSGKSSIKSVKKTRKAALISPSFCMTLENMPVVFQKQHHIWTLLLNGTGFQYHTQPCSTVL